MARTTITVRHFQPNGTHTEDFGDAIDAVNGMRVARAEPERTVIRYTNDHASNAFSIVVRAGDKPAAQAAGQGDLTISVPAQGTRWLGPFDSGRFMQSDGSMEIDFTGTSPQGGITVFHLPKNT
ncbi:hypothetical protein ACFXOS_19710 [Streptomyces sp. NPDC059175]|uniref:hypothetical protein n=1 Tax=Streptomyces sp. NPDC059175 TaxID=3346757 RepID=UPI003676650B